MHIYTVMVVLIICFNFRILCTQGQLNNVILDHRCSLVTGAIFCLRNKHQAYFNEQMVFMATLKKNDTYQYLLFI